MRYQVLVTSKGPIQPQTLGPFDTKLEAQHSAERMEDRALMLGTTVNLVIQELPDDPL